MAKAAAALAIPLVALAGCGGGEGVRSGATVAAYVVQPLCAEAAGELRRAGDRAGDLYVRAVCLPPVERSGRLRLATAGANARRATEDSTAVAFLEAPGRAAGFSRPILETAAVPLLTSSSGKEAMAKLLAAVEKTAGSGSLRTALADELE